MGMDEAACLMQAGLERSLPAAAGWPAVGGVWGCGSQLVSHISQGTIGVGTRPHTAAAGAASLSWGVNERPQAWTQAPLACVQGAIVWIVNVPRGQCAGLWSPACGAVRPGARPCRRLWSPGPFALPLLLPDHSQVSSIFHRDSPHCHPAKATGPNSPRPKPLKPGTR